MRSRVVAIFQFSKHFRFWWIFEWISKRSSMQAFTRANTHTDIFIRYMMCALTVYMPYAYTCMWLPLREYYQKKNKELKHIYIFGSRDNPIIVNIVASVFISVTFNVDGQWCKFICTRNKFIHVTIKFAAILSFFGFLAWPFLCCSPTDARWSLFRRACACAWVNHTLFACIII